MKTFLSLFALFLAGFVGVSTVQKYDSIQRLHEIEQLAEEKAQSVPVAPAQHGALKIPIFIYHSVRPHIPHESRAQDAYDITPELLEQELRYLRDNGYTTIGPDELARELQAGTTSPIARPVMLTFDDGWRNQYEYAFPLLKKYGATAAFYIYTKPIGRYAHFLTWEQIKEMQAAGMTIGSHTLTHPYLGRISDEQLRAEVFDSRKILEAKLSAPIVHFASPFGYTSPRLVEFLKEAGYKTGRTTFKSIYHTKDELLHLTAILVNDNFSDFVAMLKH